MLSKETEARVAKILTIIAENERSIEISRQILSQIPEYDPFSIFRAFDKNSKNKIDYNDINNFLHSKGIFASENEIKLFILFYDEDSDNFLSYYEFLNIIQSHDFKSRVNAFSNNENIPYNVEYSFSKILEKEISLSRNIIPYLEDLKSRVDFSIHGIYNNMKIKNYVDDDSIKKFLDRNSICYLEDDIKLIRKRLDFNNDGKIDLNEFHSFFGFPGCVRCCPPKSFNCSCPCLLCSPPPQIPISNLDISNNLNENNGFNNFNNNNNFSFIDCNKNNFNNNYVNSQESTYFKTTGNDYSNLNNDYYNEIGNFNNINQQINNSNLNFQQMINQQNPYLNNIKQNELNNNSLYKKITQNLFLRFSPERKFSPNECRICRCEPCICYTNLLKQINVNSNNLNDNNNLQYIKNKNTIYGQNELEENQLNDFLKELMLIESNVEKLKIDIALKSDFNIEEAFRIFETAERNYLIDKDLKSGLHLLNVYVNDFHIRLLMKRFDLQKKSFLNFSDFFDMIVPFEKDYRNMVEKRYPNKNNSYKDPEVFKDDTKYVLQYLFSKLIEGEIKLNNMKKEYSTFRIKLRDIFTLIDQCCLGAFSKEELDNYLKQNCIFTSTKDSDLLFIRLDKNRDGKVDFDEFLYELQPLY